MTLIAIATSLTGFYFLYNTSSRADVRQDKLSRWLQRQPFLSKAIGLCLLSVSVISFVLSYGLGVGVLFAFVTVMTSASLIILLSPLLTRN